MNTSSAPVASASRRAPVTAAAPPATAPAPLAGMAALCDALSSTFAERSSVIRAIARAFLAGEHVFILGEPGTGKSLLIRCFSQALGLSYWECLMGKFTTPEQLFGPLSIPGLQADRFTRAWKGYMPAFEVCFLDEVWKSNPGVLNSLLSITNERIFHDDGKALPAALKTLVTASNELPEAESELAALYDRCVVRLETRYIVDDDAFRTFIASPTPTVPTVAIDFAAEQAATKAVTVPDDVFDALVTLSRRIRDAGLKVSDRKWKQVIGLIKASAHLEGRTVAELDDLECLEDCLWRVPEERTNVTRIIQEVANPSGARAVALLDQAKGLLAGLPVVDDKDPSSKSAFLGKVASVNGDLKDIATQLDKLPTSRKVTSVRAEVKAIRENTSRQAAKAAGII